MKFKFVSLLKIEVIIPLFTTVLATTWALSKDSVIADLQKKTVIDSLRVVAKSSNDNKKALIDLKDSIIINLHQMRIIQTHQNENLRAVTTTLKDHVWQTSKDRMEIERMFNSLGPYLNDIEKKNLNPTPYCVILSNRGNGK